MTSDVKLSHYLLLIKVNRDANSQIIQKTITRHHPVCECRKTSTAEYISLQTVFILIQMFLSLNWNMNGYHHKYFSVEIAFYNYYAKL